ncbi:MAG TPA: universal stress protein [Gaiellaceae bacterium]|nr:universal stress protein [Gaiellaceae bacterium]
MFAQILMAWDGSPVAESAFDVALDLARRYEAQLYAVSVAHAPVHAETSADRRESVDAARRYLEATFAQVRDRAVRTGIEVEHVLLEADEPVSALLDYAHEHGFDLLVVGHHRRTRPGRLLIRDLAGRTLDASDIPVLVVCGPASPP